MKAMRWWHGIILIALAAIALMPFSSQLPDGLEWAAERLKIKGHEWQLLKAPFPDYTFPAVHGFIGNVLAVIIGVLLISAVTCIIARALLRWRSKSAN